MMWKGSADKINDEYISVELAIRHISDLSPRAHGEEITLIIESQQCHHHAEIQLAHTYRLGAQMGSRRRAELELVCSLFGSAVLFVSLAALCEDHELISSTSQKSGDSRRTEPRLCDRSPQLTAFNVPSNLCRVGNGNEMLIKNLCITYS